MNKLITALIIAALIAASVAFVVAYDIPLTAPGSFDGTDAGQAAAYCDEAYNEYISVVGEASRGDVAALMVELSKLPDSLQKSFVSGNGMVYLTSFPLGEILNTYHGMSYQPNERATGFFIVNPEGFPEIWLTSSTGAIAAATLHEFGHYFDFLNGWISAGDLFLPIYEAERHGFKNHITGEEHFTSNAAEYFAEAFACFIDSPDALKEHCPETYNFFEFLHF